MRIAFYCPNKPLSHPHPSGDLVIAQGIRKALQAMGHDCSEIAEFRSRWFWTHPLGWGRALMGLFRAYKRSRSFKPQIWLTYHTYYKSPDVLGPWICRLLGIPLVLFQPMYATKRRRDSKTRMGFYFNQLAIRTACHVFINNINDLEAMKRIRRPDQITYLPPGIFPEEFQRDGSRGMEIRRRYRISENVPLVVTVARFRYGIKFLSLSYLFRSLNILQKTSLPFMLMVVGDGPAEDHLRAMAGRFLGDRVVFAGRVPRQMLAHYYSAGNVFAFPGIGESLGMVYLEAQACGLPVVALDTAGVPQVVKGGQTGILVPDDGGESMALALERLLRDPELRRTMGDGGVDYVRRERNLHRNYCELSGKLREIAERYA